ncbi:MAG TPA: DUF1553 domain-containing protein, partial [Methylomirabilota bacterium]|nr:DUF1553 domain-containing protein [Methylomirabilota bacterium]
TAQNYYGLYGIFHSTRYPWPGIELEQKQRDLVPLVPPEKLAEADAARKVHDAEGKRLEKELQKVKDSLKEKQGEEKKAVEAQIKDAEKAVKDHKNKPLPFELAYAVAEAKKAEDVRVQMKGDPAKPGPIVRRHFLTVLSGAALPADEPGSGRKQLADWILDQSNPLTARVMANRLWQHHFGKGIVPTPNDFGKQGKPPTHPELLDWLARRFIDDGWSIKSMHRKIMLSHTYRQASGPVNSESVISNQSKKSASPADPLNTVSLITDYFSPFPRRRLDAEAIRDTLLVLGGNLDTKPPRGHPFPPPTEWKFTQHNPFKAVYDTRQRSVYLMTQRIQRHPYLAIFDGADPAASTPVRTTSTTPLQALYLLNDSFVHEQSKLFAKRIVSQGKNDAERAVRAYRLSLGRKPDASESRQAKEFLVAVRAKLRERETPADKIDAEAWQAMVRVIFRLNEFVYID